MLHREKTTEASTNKLVTSEVNQTTYLQLLPVILSHGKNSVSAVAFLDSGSDSSLVSKILADKLQLSGKEQNLVLSNVMSISNEIRSELASFSVSSPSQPHPFKMTNIWAVDNLRLLKQKIGIEDSKGSYQHFRHLDFTSIDNSDVAILIGADFPQFHSYRDIKIGNDHEPLAIQYTLG